MQINSGDFVLLIKQLLWARAPLCCLLMATAQADAYPGVFVCAQLRGTSPQRSPNIAPWGREPTLVT